MIGGNYWNLFILFFVGITCPVQCIKIHTKDDLKMQQGICLPRTLRVAEGNQISLKLIRGLENMETCTVTSPDGQTVDVKQPNDRYEAWSEFCGVKVSNIKEDDEGRWRLTMRNSTMSLTGWSDIFIIKPTSNYHASPTTLIDGETHTEVELTTLDTSYCIVTQPFRDGTLIPGHCQVQLDKTSRAVQGNWWLLMGLPGQVKELRVAKQVNVEAERLDVGYIYDSNLDHIHLFCNMLHTTKNVTFCRFQQTTSDAGFNLIDGLSDGKHSYYGKGFVRKECGMTIENPKDEDYGSWRCSVGLQQWEGTHIVQQTPMQALITFSRSSVGNRQTIKEGDTRTVFVRKNTPFTLTCKSDESLRYCWFQHPNGTQFTPGERNSEDQEFWFTEDSLQTGDCNIHFSSVSEEDSGQWTCHMGARAHSGLEITEAFNVRVTGPLAANKQKLEVRIGQSATVLCHTSNGNYPLEYCRFLSPEYVGFSLDDSVTEDKAISDRFYFTPEKSLDHGDCSLNIKEVREEDLGEWTCAALVNEGSSEASDTILLVASSSPANGLSRASITGMAVGLSIIVIASSGFLIYKYGKRLPSLWQSSEEEVRPSIQISDMIELGSRRSGDTMSVCTSSSEETNPRS